MTDRREILLESGTNEVEFMEFFLGSQHFGVNVSKVREIIPYDPKIVTEVPETYRSVLGMIILRNTTLTLIDLKKHLEIDEPGCEGETQVVMVCEFNNMVNGFLVDGVNQIHRCSWKDISPLSNYVSRYRPAITSSVSIDDRNIMMVDLEHVLADIYPETRLVYREEEDPKHASDIPHRHEERERAHIVVAEDSPIVRASLKKVTGETGYTNIAMFDNGEDAYNYVAMMADKAKDDATPITDLVAAVVTDIEMPKMDGLTLCRKVKEDLNLPGLPVVVFSSLINDQMILKCKSVGADGWANKLKIAELVHILDYHALGVHDAMAHSS